MALTFNIEGFTNEVLNELQKELEFAFETWKVEVENKMRNHEFKVNAYVDSEMKKSSNMIIAYLKANTYVLADSYGTGSLMLSDNPGFKNYMMKTQTADSNKPSNKPSFNPSRKGKAIAGRPRGEYTDILGHHRTTKGTFKGKNIEGVRLKTGYRILPVAPSYSIQMANNWLWKTYLPRAYKNAIEQVSFTKYLIES